MFVESISLENIRTFVAEKTVTFNHPDSKYGEGHELPHAPKLRNVNLLFGENAAGKTTLLEAIALAALGPAVSDSRIAPRPLVRFAPTTRKPSPRETSKEGQIRVSLALHESEILTRRGEKPPATGFSELAVRQRGELEQFEAKKKCAYQLGGGLSVPKRLILHRGVWSDTTSRFGDFAIAIETPSLWLRTRGTY